MIRSVHFKNFKALRDVALDLEPLTVIVGPNASGKTSILQGIYNVAHLETPRPPDTLQGYGRAPGDVRTSGDEGEVTVVVEGDFGECQVRLVPDSANNTAPAADPAKVGWRLEYAKREPHEKDTPWEKIPACGARGGAPLTAILLDLDFDRLVAPSYSEQSEPTMSGRGEGLASALVFMKLNREAEFVALFEALRSVVPSVRRLHFRRERLTRSEPEVLTLGNDRITRQVQRDYWADSLVFDVQGANDVPAPQMSEGTLFVLGLLAVLMGSSPPDVVLIDDLERGVHPKAQRVLVRLLRQIRERRPGMQIVATTHSPYMLDDVKAHEVRLTSLGDDGSVACVRLDTHPDFEKWREEMTPGEFWSIVGENWANDRVPAGAL